MQFLAGVKALGRTAVAVMVAGLATTAAQAAPLPGFSLKARTERFSFYTRDDRPVDAKKTESYLYEVERLLGARYAGHAEYYRYGSPEELAAGTGTYAAGLTYVKAGQIHSTQDFHAHEIVHLVAGQLGNPGMFFQEGLAVAIGNAGRWQGKDVDKLARAAAKGRSIAILVAEFQRMDADTAYAVAGSFVRSLVKAHGIAKVGEFFRSCNGRNTEAAFATTFGRSLDEAGADWARRL